MLMDRWKVIGTAGPVLALAAVIVAVIVFDLTTDSGGATEPLGLATPMPTRRPGPTWTPGPTLTPTPEPTALPGAEERDAQRRLELEALRKALVEYREEHGSYPDTGGNIQSLCVYRDLDAGCELEEFLEGPLPEDPLGEPLNNGYWYMSDGKSFALISQQEVSTAPPEAACPATPPERDFPVFYCVTGR
jgi:hypothetical protein